MNVLHPLLMLGHDGVLVDSLDVFSSALIEACRQLGISGVATPEDVVALAESDILVSLRAAGADDERSREALRRTAGTLRNALPWLRPFPLMPEVVAELAETRHLAMFALGDGELVKTFLRRRRIVGVGEVVGGGVDESRAAAIETLMTRFPGQETYWFVGATAGDIRAARQAGATPLGVAWGWHDPELLEAAGAERVAASPVDLLAIVAPELSADFLGMG
jgi:phosphoglycolate phosphatase